MSDSSPAPETCQPPRCPACGHVAAVIYVHGHGQCAKCGTNTEPCCQPDEPTLAHDDDAPGPGPLALRCSSLSHVPHGFSTRCGGVSRGPFAALNFGNPSTLDAGRRDSSANIAENFRRLLSSVNASGRRVVQVHQVHGAAVDVVTAAIPRAEGPDPLADALVTDDPSLMLAVRTADCLPILLSSADGRVVGAVHAGWRGIIAGVVVATVHAMAELGATEIVAALGPCIGGDAFEVGPEVAEQFDRYFATATLVVLRRPEWPRPHVDLRRAAFLQLASAGVASAQVIPHCTYQQRGLFYSHRRDGARPEGTGRMASVIGPAAR